MRILSSAQKLFCLSLTVGLGVVGCTEKADVVPGQDGCDTPAIVRLCKGKTGVCLTEHTILELPNGVRLHPAGDKWEAYEVNQIEGQALLIGYTLTPHIMTYAPGEVNGNITCLRVADWCGTPVSSGN